MSLLEELARNRAVFRRLGGTVVEDARPDASGEAGGVGEDAFLRSLRSREGGFQNALRALEGDRGFGEAGAVSPLSGEFERVANQSGDGEFQQTAVVSGPVRVPSVAAPGTAGGSAAAVEYPGGSSGGADHGEGGDLLDSLLRRIEAQGRLYPQELDGDGGWQV